MRLARMFGVAAPLLFASLLAVMAAVPGHADSAPFGGYQSANGEGEHAAGAEPASPLSYVKALEAAEVRTADLPAVPGPAALSLLGAGLFGLVALRRRPG